MYYHRSVKDFEGAKKFYSEILEFEFAYETPPEFGWCEYKLPVEGTRIGLLRTDEGLTNKNPADSLNISVLDLEEVKKILDEKGVETSEIIDVPDMISMFDIKDPEGNKITFLGLPRIKTEKE